MTHTYSILHLFSGIGGGCLGFQQARAEHRGITGSFRTLAGVDVDPASCEDFRNLTGAPAVELDLFTRDDYTAFHGHEPPANWREVTAQDLLATTMGEHPDVVFLSPPCKSFSGLLPKAKADTAKYQALSNLVPRGLELLLQAFGDDPPALIMLENVPRITTRGAKLIEQVKSLLGAHGYVFHGGYHDCGEIGGLAQHRKRYLLIARHEAKMPQFVYCTPRKRVKAIGEVIGPLPMPDDPTGGPMHRLPLLQWKTWVRLALIPAGGDWRDLEAMPNVRLEQRDSRHPNVYHVERWDEPSACVTGTRFGSGAPAVADPRLSPHCGKTFNGSPGLMGVMDWNKPASTVTGTMRPASSNAPASIADPRFNLSENAHANLCRVQSWDAPGYTVTGATRPAGGAQSVADPRIGCKPRSGSYGVTAWDQPASTVIGAGDIHASASAVADPRIPADNERPNPVPVIVALDGTWHRPLTTLELAALQGFPLTMPDGRPLTLAGKSDARFRERIGNAVPPPAARAIGEQMLQALMLNQAGEMSLGFTGIWVRERDRARAVFAHD